MLFPRFARVIFALPLLAVACAVDTAPTGLRATPSGTGPRVVYDVTHRPFPNIPIPNDVATFPDPTSRTGRRINASLVAPASFEQKDRAEIDELEGWGTSAPLSVSFTRGASGDPRDAAIDLAEVKRRMTDDGYDFSNDSVYVINLTTGVPALLDMGHGNFPPAVTDPTLYWPNDPHAASSTLLFETNEEGAGLTQRSYTPSLDLDFDGVLDHPNTLGHASSPKYEGVDNLLTWYERETDTLILKPLVPLEEKTEYAVVLTDRLVGPDGQAVRSPFAFVHHPQQQASVAKVAAVLRDTTFQNYYGSISGTGLDHVAFAWTFTTEPVYEDIRLLRDGLYGKGPFARFSAQFPPKVDVLRSVGITEGADQPAGWDAKPECAIVAKKPFMTSVEPAKKTVHDFLVDILKVRENQAALLIDELSAVDHFVIGSYQVPYLVGDPKSVDPFSHFHVNFMTGEGDVTSDSVYFWLAVPKARPEKGFKQPFPVSFWRHGAGQSTVEVLIQAGHFAAQGLALFGIDAPGHGFVLDPGQKILARAFLSQACLVPFLDALTKGRALDLDGDGTLDPGGLLLSAHIAHTRDLIRQANFEAHQGMRVLRSFDGQTSSGVDYNGDGTIDLAGDFDADGTPDLGGPSVPYYAAGDSFGGIMTTLQGATDPNIVAVAAISGGAGLIDVASRSSLVPDSALEQIMSPFVVAVPADDRPADATGPNTACKSGQRSVRLVVNDLLKSRELEIACLDPAELSSGMTVVLENVATKDKRCARSGTDGRFRLGVPANVGDKLDVQIYPAPDVVDSYAKCNVVGSPAAGRHVATWEVGATKFTPVADPAATCTADAGCQQYRETFYDVGTPLVAPQEGLGYARQTPDFRRFFGLGQISLDLADPINFARYYFLAPLPGIDGAPAPPRGILMIPTVGDPLVPTAFGDAFARAAGLIPFLPTSAATKFPEYAAYATPASLASTWGGKTPNELLIANAVLEGEPRFGRTPAGPRCALNYAPSATCTDTTTPDPTTCENSLFDADWLSEGAQLFDQEHPVTPLRLARAVSVKIADAASLEAAWAPRGKTPPFATDAAGWKPGPALGALVNAYPAPLGQHVWFIGDPCKAWDDVTYHETMLAHFLGSGGTDLYYLTHPKTHACMATRTCDFFK